MPIFYKVVMIYFQQAIKMDTNHVRVLYEYAEILRDEIKDYQELERIVWVFVIFNRW